jgi:integrase
MPCLKLTQAAVERLKPPVSGRVDYWDTVLPGFGLRLSALGRRSWQVMYRVDGRKVRETLGTVAGIPNVADARTRARASIGKAQAGIHPVEERRRQRLEERRRAAAEEARRRDTVAAVLDRYLAQHAAKRLRPSTFAEVRRCLAVDVKAKLGGLPIAELTRRDIRVLLDGIVARGRASHAHHVIAYLRPALAWAVEREIISSSPAVGIPDPDPRRREARTRDRYLDDDEIRLFGQACATIGWPFGPALQLLLLTGQRRNELTEATWSEFDLDKALWTLPRERIKTGKAHLVHLAPLAVDILAALPRIGSRGLLFTTTGNSPISGFGRGQERVEARMRARCQQELVDAGGARAADDAGIAHFTIHDLRRTAATGMARIGIAQHVVEKILNHTAGKISGVAAVYNRYEYLDERKAALEAWGRHVEGLIRRDAAGTVVKLKTGTR